VSPLHDVRCMTHCLDPVKAAKGFGGGTVALVVTFAAVVAVTAVGDALAVAAAALLTVLVLLGCWTVARTAVGIARRRGYGAPARREPGVERVPEDLVGELPVRVTARVVPTEPRRPALPPATAPAVEGVVVNRPAIEGARRWTASAFVWPLCTPQDGAWPWVTMLGLLAGSWVTARIWSWLTHARQPRRHRPVRAPFPRWRTAAPVKATTAVLEAHRAQLRREWSR